VDYDNVYRAPEPKTDYNAPRAPEPKTDHDDPRRWRVVIKPHNNDLGQGYRHFPLIISNPLSLNDAFDFARTLLNSLPPSYRIQMEPD
jgi:hypothetical protein